VAGAAASAFALEALSDAARGSHGRASGANAPVTGPRGVGRGVDCGAAASRLVLPSIDPPRQAVRAEQPCGHPQNRVRQS